MLKDAISQLLKLALVFGILLLGLKGCNSYAQYDAQKFCDDLKNSDTENSIHQKATKLGYFIQKRTDLLIIDTQQSPFFRFACKAELVDGKFVRGEVISTD